MSTVNLWVFPSFVLGSAFSPAGLEDTARMEYYVRQMCQWVTRGQCSASVSMSLFQASNMDSDPRTSRLLESLIRPYTGCFRSLELDTSQGQLSPLFDGRSSFPQLQSLSLCFSFLDLDIWLWRQGLSSSAPRLRNLRISAGIVLSSHSSMLNGFTASFPWSQLSTLDMLGTLLNVRVWWDILHQCSFLQMGRFTVQPNPPHSSQNLMALEHLTSLHIKFQTQFLSRTALEIFDDRIFDSLSFPILQVLHVTAKVNGSDPLHFVAWMRRQSATLASLTLEVRLPDTILLELLESHQNLEKLALYLPHGDVLQCKPAFQVIEERRLPQMRVLAIISAAATYDSPRRARFTSFEALVFDLTKSATTWAALGAPPDSEFQIFADGEVLAAVKSHLLALHDTLVVASQVSELPSTQCNDRQIPKYLQTYLRIQRGTKLPCGSEWP